MTGGWLDRVPAAARLSVARVVALAAMLVAAAWFDALPSGLVVLATWALRPLSRLHAAVTAGDRWTAPDSPALALGVGGWVVRDGLLQAFGWTAAGLIGWRVAAATSDALALPLLGSILQGHGELLGASLGAACGIALLVTITVLPRQLQRAQLSGRLGGRSVADVLELGANLYPVALALEAATWILPAAQSQFVPLFALWGVHAIVRLADFPGPSATSVLWVVVLPGSANAEHGDAVCRAINDAVRRWPSSPVVALLPQGGPWVGEHQVAATASGVPALLEPRLPVHLADWLRSVPPAAQWAGLLLREMRLAPELFAVALQSLPAAGDRLLLLAADATPVAPWLALAAGRQVAVCRLDLPPDSALGLSTSGLAGAVAAGGAGKVRTLLRALRTGPVGGSALPPADFAPDAPAIPSYWRVGLLALAGGLVSAMLFVVLRVQLNQRTDATFETLAALPLLVTPPAPLPVAGVAERPRLAILLQSEIKASKLEVRDEADRSVITLSDDALFSAGSAGVSAKLMSVLDRVGSALAAYPGRVSVIGHTDNSPVRALRYPSNWHLSVARARAVMEVLATRVAPERLRAEGRGDTEPVVANDTPANRGRNRRVEITLFAAPAAAVADAAASASAAAPASGPK